MSLVLRLKIYIGFNSILVSKDNVKVSHLIITAVLSKQDRPDRLNKIFQLNLQTQKKRLSHAPVRLPILEFCLVFVIGSS